ncbi:magnesium chelatase subunit D [uncultured Roseobacter sp.]|uniref:magnesium chelatase subunit D n=1 Tax=uncultured Roseobacter sp. TaxID=114847 RepID=UPI0026351BD2|nr:magnesium chelatase subunit D [uncultured Roseobacter sp.]
MSAAPDSWARAAMGLRLLRAAPGYLGGAVIRMRASPLRDRVTDTLRPLEARRIFPGIDDTQLFGGLDLSGTLASGQVMKTAGLFDAPAIAVLVMAERCGPDLAARIAQQLDRGMGHAVIALDEGAEADEITPAALRDRLPLWIAPEGRMPTGWTVPEGDLHTDPARIAATLGDADTLTQLAAAFGIHSLRAPLLALRTARVNAALAGRSAITAEDLETAASLVYPQRATQVPEAAEQESQPPEPPETQEDAGSGKGDRLPDGDMLVDAVRALLPPDLLAGLASASSARGGSGSGAGSSRKGNRRGRPLPSRPGRLDGRARIDLVATLHAAAPWQPLRRRAQPKAQGLLIRPSDIRLKRYEERSDRLLIFAVDASGSAAVARLNEAKGAVALMLAEAYAARDHVALISFRGTQAELLLPPTRSLVQTKRRLESLPGGGGTPLAHGLREAAALAVQARGKGLTPTLLVLTDGRANIALDGTTDRARAASDAEDMARVIRAQGVETLVIDVSQRPQPGLSRLAQRFDGGYLALPRADARKITGAVSAALDG